MWHADAPNTTFADGRTVLTRTWNICPEQEELATSNAHCPTEAAISQ